MSPYRVKTADFEFNLPAELIAQTPLPQRDQSRLLVLQRSSSRITHHEFRELLDNLQAGDVLVLNNSRVIPARLRGMNAKTQGQFELLLIQEKGVNDWWVLIRPGKRAHVGTHILLKDTSGNPTNIQAKVVEINHEGHRRLQFSGTPNLLDLLDKLGEIPLPPYIRRGDLGELTTDNTRYQTVYAKASGSVAAPTAGLHFTEELLTEIRALGVYVCFVTLHVGLGTFAPVKADNVSDHVMHEEHFEITADTVRTINAARQTGHRIVAVGTTSLRVLESVAAQNCGSLVPGKGHTRIFIHPPHAFKIVDALLTNFHLPRSTLLMLVSAFAAPGETRGREMILSAYAEAIRERYRFFSYGDAMLII
jgi:S-adenosylmethionine:tRNA ribosyltransferase-isomerase